MKKTKFLLPIFIIFVFLTVFYPYNNKNEILAYTPGGTQPAPTNLWGTGPTSYGGSNGKISGASSSMEYKKVGSSVYKPATGYTIYNLTSGNYYVRYKGDDLFGLDASPTTTVTVPCTYYTKPTSTTREKENTRSYKTITDSDITKPSNLKEKYLSASDFTAKQRFSYTEEKSSFTKGTCPNWTKSWNDNGTKNSSITLGVELVSTEDNRFGYYNSDSAPSGAIIDVTTNYGHGTIDYTFKTTGSQGGKNNYEWNISTYWVKNVEITLNNPKSIYHNTIENTSAEIKSGTQWIPGQSDRRSEDSEAVDFTCTKIYGGTIPNENCTVTSTSYTEQWGGSFPGSFDGTQITTLKYYYSDTHNKAGKKHSIGVWYFHIKEVIITIPIEEEYVDRFDSELNKCYLIYYDTLDYDIRTGSTDDDVTTATQNANYEGSVVDCTDLMSVTYRGDTVSRENLYTETNQNKIEDYQYIDYEHSHTGSISNITEESGVRTQTLAYPKEIDVYDIRDNPDNPDTKYTETYVLTQRPFNDAEDRDDYGIGCKRWWNRINDNDGNILPERTDNCVNDTNTSDNIDSSTLGSTATELNGTTPYQKGRKHEGTPHLSTVPLGDSSHYWHYGYVDKWNWVSDKHKVNYILPSVSSIKTVLETGRERAQEKIIERYVLETHKNGQERLDSSQTETDNHSEFYLGYENQLEESYPTPTCEVYFIDPLIEDYENQNGTTVESGDLEFKDFKGKKTQVASTNQTITMGGSTQYIKRDCFSETDSEFYVDDNHAAQRIFAEEDLVVENYSPPGGHYEGTYYTEYLSSPNWSNYSPEEYDPDWFAVNYNGEMFWDVDWSSTIGETEAQKYKENLQNKQNLWLDILEQWELGKPYRLKMYFYSDNGKFNSAAINFIYNMHTQIEIDYTNTEEETAYTKSFDIEYSPEPIQEVFKTHQDKPYGTYSCTAYYAPKYTFDNATIKTVDCLPNMFKQSDTGQNMLLNSAEDNYNNSRTLSYNYVNNNYNDRTYEERVYAHTTEIMFGDNHPKGSSGTIIPEDHVDEDITGSRTNYRCRVIWQDNPDWQNNGEEEITYLENELTTSDPNYSKIWYSTYIGQTQPNPVTSGTVFNYIGVNWLEGYEDVSEIVHKPEDVNQFYPVDPIGGYYSINCDYPHNTYNNNLSSPSYVEDQQAIGEDLVLFNLLGIQDLKVYDYTDNGSLMNPEGGLEATDILNDPNGINPFHFEENGTGKTYETGHWYNFNAVVIFQPNSNGQEEKHYLNDPTLLEKNWRYGFVDSTVGILPTTIELSNLCLDDECHYPNHIETKTQMKLSGHDHRLPFDSGDTNKWNTFRIDYFSEGPNPHQPTSELKGQTYEEVVLWAHRPIDLIINGPDVVDYDSTHSYTAQKIHSDESIETTHAYDDPNINNPRLIGNNNNPYTVNTTPTEAETIENKTILYWETDANLLTADNVNPISVNFGDFKGDKTKRTIYAYWGDVDRLQTNYDYWDYLYKEKVVTINFDCNIEFKTVVQGCDIHNYVTEDGPSGPELIRNWRFPTELEMELDYIFLLKFNVTGINKGSGNH